MTQIIVGNKVMTRRLIWDAASQELAFGMEHFGLPMSCQQLNMKNTKFGHKNRVVKLVSGLENFKK